MFLYVLCKLGVTPGSVIAQVSAPPLVDRLTILDCLSQHLLYMDLQDDSVVLAFGKPSEFLIERIL